MSVLRHGSPPPASLPPQPYRPRPSAHRPPPTAHGLTVYGLRSEEFAIKNLAAGGTRRSPPGFGVGRAFRCLAILAQRRARRPVSRAGTSNNCVGAVQTERAITSLVKKLGVDE